MNSSTDQPKISKFLFEREFDHQLAVPNSRAEAEAKKLAQAYAEGMAAGEAVGLARGHEEKAKELEGQIAALLGKIQKAIANLLSEVTQYQGQLIEQTHALALAAFNQLHPELARKGEIEEVGALLKMVLNDQLEEPRINIHVCRDSAEKMEEPLNQIALQEAYNGKIQILSDPHLQLGDCRIEWRHGGIERDLTALQEAVQNILSIKRRNE